ncbi:MAG: RNA methyltransferase [Thermodesulfovibrionales bacterium]|nr:RNA methyltransferase [Thermodesulfovibrionales bacterium]
MRYTELTSPQNPLIKELVKIRNRPAGYRHKEFIIEGPHLIRTAIASGAPVKKVFFTEGFAGKKEGGRLLRELQKKDLEMFEITENILRKITDTEAPQGIVALSSYAPLRLEDLSFKDIPLIAVSDGVSDPGNMGAMIRTADAAGADAFIVLPGSCDPFMSKCLRASQGSVFNIPVVNAEMKNLIDWLRGGNIEIAATHQKAGHSIYDADLSGPLAIIFGNESEGVSAEMRAAADMEIGVPIPGRAESLNVASAAAVIIFEAVRQRGPAVNLGV